MTSTTDLNKTSDLKTNKNKSVKPPTYLQRCMIFAKLSSTDKLKVIWRSLTTCCNSLPRIFAIFIGLGFIAVSTFAWVEDQNWIDSLYWMSTTSTTTGYGDIAPKKELGKLLTSLFMHAWYILGAIFLANLIAKILHDPHIWSDAEQRALLATVRRTEIRQMIDGENLRRMMRRPGARVEPLPEPTFDKNGDVTNITVNELPALATLPPVINDSSASAA